MDLYQEILRVFTKKNINTYLLVDQKMVRTRSKSVDTYDNKNNSNSVWLQ